MRRVCRARRRREGAKLRFIGPAGDSGGVIQYRWRAENAEVNREMSARLLPFPKRRVFDAMSDLFMNRRNWICTFAAATTVSAVAWDDGKAVAAETSQKGAMLVADPTRDLFRVRVELDIEGNVNVPSNALVSKEKAVQVPVRSRSVLDWEERLLGFNVDRTGHSAERFYYEAQSTGKVGKKEQSVRLRSQSQAVRIQRDAGQWVIYSPDVYLEGQEIDLLKVPASSLAVDGLLPTVAVKIGDEYEPEKDVLAKLLSLAAVQESTVVGEVVTLDQKSSKIHFKGRVEGSVSGVPTTIDLVAKLVFDREQAACTWVALAIHEVREIGKSEPGFDIAGTIRMIRKPLDAPARLSSKPPADIPAQVPADRLLTELSSAAVGYSVLMDRHWKIMSDAAGASMMRMVEDDRGIAQANLHPAGKMAAGTQLTLEAFVGESRKSMGDRFVELLQSKEEVNSAGLRVMRATIQGAVQGVPVQWIMIQFSNDSGRRLMVTFTVGNEHLDAFAGSDEQLIGSLQFLPMDDPTVDVATGAAERSALK